MTIRIMEARYDAAGKTAWSFIIGHVDMRSLYTQVQNMNIIVYKVVEVCKVSKRVGVALACRR